MSSNGVEDARSRESRFGSASGSALRIAVICGGPSPERGISLNSARSVLDHLDSSQVDISAYYVDTDLVAHSIPPSQLYSNTPSDFDFRLRNASAKGVAVNSPPLTVNSPPIFVLSPPMFVNSPPMVVNSTLMVVNSPPMVVNSPPLTVSSTPLTVNPPPLNVNPPPMVVNSPPMVVNSTLMVVNSPHMVVNSPPLTVN